MGAVEFDEALARQAAERLDGLADTLDRNYRNNGQALTPASAGIDDVSRHAAQTFDGVAESYASAYGNGVHELRKLAANLRSHVRTFASAEADSAGALSALQ
jgi:uncharacterized protein YukE